MGGRVVERGLIALGLGHFGEFQRVGAFALYGAHNFNLVSQARAFAADRLGEIGFVPESRVLDPRVQFVQATKGDIPVKDAS